MEDAPKMIFNQKIFALANKPDVVVKIKEINNEYLYWDKVKYKKILDLDPIQLWSAVKNGKSGKLQKYLFW